MSDADRPFEPDSPVNEDDYSSEDCVFNGLNAATGEYGLAPRSVDALTHLIDKTYQEPADLEEQKKKARQAKYDDLTEAIGQLKTKLAATEDAARRQELEAEIKQREQEREQYAHLGVVAGVEATNLAEAGWGIVFAYKADPAIQAAVQPLLDLRRQQAGRRFKIFAGPDAYRPPETKNQFLTRFGVGAGDVDPSLLDAGDPNKGVPYYLLLVGSPTDIPFHFQYQLSVQFAVGRIDFDRLQDYEQYARSVVAVEQGDLKLPRRLTFFSPENPYDRATQLSTSALVEPLIQEITQEVDKAQPGQTASVAGWQLEAHLRQAATKEQLVQLLGGEETPALLFTASHGVEFPRGHAQQYHHQGAILCQDWPGPRKWRQPIPPTFYFSGDDLTTSAPSEALGTQAKLLGLISFHFACYGAGMPQFNSYARQDGQATAAEIAEQAFIAQLPKRLLSHPQGGALAVIGHVERAWGYSFAAAGRPSNTPAFRSVLLKLMQGQPVGAAIESLNIKYAELATELTDIMDKRDFNLQVDPLDLTSLWTSHNDARDFFIIGDPAVRLPVADPAETPLAGRPIVTPNSQANPPIQLSSGWREAEAQLTVSDGFTEVVLDESALADFEAVQQLAEHDPGFGQLRPTEIMVELAEVGWGVIFASDTPEAIKAALQPLLARRQQQAGDYFKSWAYQPGQTWTDFLSRTAKVGHLNVFNPARNLLPEAGEPYYDEIDMPYYLLLVGSPTAIPYSFEQQLSLRYAVGRLHFDTVDEYRQYAASVVEAETQPLKLAPQLGVFSPTNDPLSRQRTDRLIKPLVEKLTSAGDWQLTTYMADQATKANLRQLLGGQQTPALGVINSRGAVLSRFDPQKRFHQGAVICQDWSPANAGAVPATDYFSRDDLDQDGKLLGLITFQLTDYGAGTPRRDLFNDHRQPFMAALPKQLLSHQQGGALAVVSYVGPVWDYSFDWPGVTQQTALVTQFCENLGQGMSVGLAMALFNHRYAELATALLASFDKFGFIDPTDSQKIELAGLWVAGQTAHQWAIIGDPAVRLPVTPAGETPGERPVVQTRGRGQVVAARKVSRKPLPGLKDEDWEKTPPAIQALLIKYVTKYGALS